MNHLQVLLLLGGDRHKSLYQKCPIINFSFHRLSNGVGGF